MEKKKKTYLDVLEATIKKLWRAHNQPKIIKALHAEVAIEPQPFVHGQLNPQVTEFLISLYLHKVKANMLQDGKVEVKDGILKILDSENNLIAETASAKIIREYLE